MTDEASVESMADRFECIGFSHRPTHVYDKVLRDAYRVQSQFLARRRRQTRKVTMFYQRRRYHSFRFVVTAAAFALLTSWIAFHQYTLSQAAGSGGLSAPATLSGAGGVGSGNIPEMVVIKPIQAMTRFARKAVNRASI